MHDTEAFPAGAARASAGSAAAPPLVEGEDRAGYDELLARVADALQPADVLEEMWVRDVVDLAWETCRLRRLKAQLMAAATYEGMAEVLKPMVGEFQGGDLAKGWAARRPGAVEKVEALLASTGFSKDHVRARALSVRLGDFRGLDQLLIAVEARRAAALGELDRHRRNFSERRRRTLAPIDTGEAGATTLVSPPREPLP